MDGMGICCCILATVPEQQLLHQEFQVPKMEGFLNLIFDYFLGGFPLT